MLILCLLFLTLAFPHFRVKEVEVKGANRYSEAELIQLSGIEIGDEIFAVNLDHAINSILKNCRYIRLISVTVHLSGKVVLNITEEDYPMYTKKDGQYISFSQSFTILGCEETAEDFAGFLYVELPDLTAFGEGGEVKFASGDKWAKTTLLSLIERLRKGNYGDKLTAVSVKNERELFYVLDGRCKVILGEAKDLDQKEARLSEILKQKGGIPETPTTFDLRNPEKIIEIPEI